MNIRDINKGILVLAVILAAVAGSFLVKKQEPRPNYSPPSKSETGQPVSTPTLEYVIKETSFDRLPGDFPANIPLESGAKIIKNYTGLSPDGDSRATLIFESSKSVGQNSDIYERFFQQNEWEIRRLVYQDAFRAISAKPDRSHEISVLMRQDSTTNKIIVEISYFTLTKK